MGVLSGVNRELRAIRERDPELARSALAESARALARRIDSKETSAAAAASCVGRLQAAMDRLHALSPVVPVKHPEPELEEVPDRVADLTAARERRRAG